MVQGLAVPVGGLGGVRDRDGDAATVQQEPPTGEGVEGDEIAGGVHAAVDLAAAHVQAHDARVLRHRRGDPQLRLQEGPVGILLDAQRGVPQDALKHGITAVVGDAGVLFQVLQHSPAETVLYMYDLKASHR